MKVLGRATLLAIGWLIGAPFGTLLAQDTLPARHRPWTTDERLLQGVAWALIITDVLQTHEMATSNWTDANGNVHYEGNPLFLTSRPSPLQVDLMGAAAAVGCWWFADRVFTRTNERRIFLGAVILLEAAAVTFNHRGGVRIRL